MSATQKPEAAAGPQAQAKPRFAVKPPPTEDEAVAMGFREDVAKYRESADVIFVKANESKRLGQEERLSELMRHRSILMKKVKVLETAAIPCADRIVAQAEAAAQALVAKGKA